jgi:ankyrin repeat protein
MTEPHEDSDWVFSPIVFEEFDYLEYTEVSTTTPGLISQNQTSIVQLLIQACLDGSLQVADILISYGVNLEARHSYHMMTPLLVAFQEGHLCLALHLIILGADVTAVDRFGNTTLHYICNSGIKTENTACVLKLLIERGANVNIAGSFGATPLHITARDGWVEGGRVLLEAGVHPGGISYTNYVSMMHYGITPLLFAVKRRNEVFVQMLVEKGANVNESDGERNTPLHCIARFKTGSNIAAILLRAGADMTIRNSRLKTPYDIARDNKCVKVLAVFEAASTSAQIQTPLVFSFSIPPRQRSLPRLPLRRVPNFSTSPTITITTPAQVRNPTPTSSRISSEDEYEDQEASEDDYDYDYDEE